MSIDTNLKPFIDKSHIYDDIDISILKYVAGLTDSDGCIHSDLKVSIGQAEKGYECLNYMYIHFGGNIRLHKDKTENHQRSYQWELNGNSALKYFKLVSPYMLLKKKQALIHIELNAYNFNKIIAYNENNEMIFQSLKECNKYFKINNNIKYNEWIIKPYYSKEDIIEIKNRLKKQIKELKTVSHDEIPIDIRPDPEYIAGICDGDACFDTHGKTSQHHNVTQKYRPLCDLLQRLYGGSVYYRSGNDTWAWEIYALAEVFLEEIAPYIVGKKKQVDLILNMKPGEALKIHAELRLLKGNCTAPTPLIDKINNNEPIIKYDYKTKAKELPKGVYNSKNGKRFRVLIRHKKEQYDLGTFDTLEEAKETYNKYKKAIMDERNGGPIVDLTFNKRYK